MISIREVIGLTALNFGVEPREILAENRHQPVQLARQVAIYVARKTTDHGTKVIGRAFGRDHTTVLHSIEKVEAEIRAAPQGAIAALVKSLIRNVEFREKIEALGGIDVLAVARRIAADPVRQSMSASVMEVAALAATTIDLWNLAEAAEEAIALERRQLEISCDLKLTPDLIAEEDENAARIAALQGAILDELAALRGETKETETNETEGDIHANRDH